MSRILPRPAAIEPLRGWVMTEHASPDGTRQTRYEPISIPVPNGMTREQARREFNLGTPEIFDPLDLDHRFADAVIVDWYAMPLAYGPLPD